MHWCNTHWPATPGGRQMTMRPFLRLCLGLVAWMTGPALAQVHETELTPNPTVRLNTSTSVPTYNVSSMRLDIGDYSIKPLYEVQGQQIRVIGFFAAALPGTTAGNNLQAIWYLRPTLDCDEWVVTTWANATAAQAAKSLKQAYGIPDAQDVFWELEVGNSTATDFGYDSGFIEGDPLAASTAAMPAEAREAITTSLKAAGYPVATLAFEKNGADAAKAWLVAHALFFDAMIGRNLIEDDFETALAAHYIAWVPPFNWDPSCELFALVCNLWFCRPSSPPAPSCEPKKLYGEWQPAGEVCNCTTVGPWSAACGTFTSNASGEIEINIPWPPPRGTKVTLSVGVGVTLNLCVCVWQRTCTGRAKRTVTTIKADCTQSTTTEYQDGRVFTAHAWTTAYPAEQCQSAARPGTMPPDGQDCGLTNNN